MQKTYINTLSNLCENDKNIIHLNTDNGTEFDRLFTNMFPEQIIDLGISENNMVGVAAGLASCGKIPFAYTAAPFLAYRSFEFIRNDICFQNLNVKMIGKESALSVSMLGPTHHSTEDISVLRSLPNLTIFSVSTALEFEKAINKAYEIIGPVYIRVELNLSEEFHENDEFDLFSHQTIAEGKDTIVYVTGCVFEEAIKAREILLAQNIEVKVVNVTALKPFNKEELLSQIIGRENIFSVEEHNIYGGLGSIISEIISEKGLPIKLTRIGLNDCFATGYGTNKELRKNNGLDGESIAKKIMLEMGK